MYKEENANSITHVEKVNYRVPIIDISTWKFVIAMYSSAF